MSPGFHGRSLLTRQLGQLTRQILPVAGAAPVVSIAPNLARGDTVMTVFTPAVTVASGALRNLPAIVTTILATS
jgi:P-type Ca2+ transporter type 2C